MIGPLAMFWRQRFRPIVFIPAAVGLAAAATAGAGSDHAGRTIVFACAVLLLAQFRLWDDLADRHRDRAAHPERVLAAATRIAPFVAAGSVLALANIVLAAWLRGTAGAAALVAFDGAAASWYAWRPAHRTAATDLVLLTKYPAFVLLLAIGSTASLPLVALSAAAIYGLACAFEIWHDASGPLRVHSQ